MYKYKSVVDNFKAIVKWMVQTRGIFCQRIQLVVYIQKYAILDLRNYT